MPFKVGGVVRFPKKRCAVCPRYVNAALAARIAAERSVSIHPDERSLEELSYSTNCVEVNSMLNNELVVNKAKEAGAATPRSLV